MDSDADWLPDLIPFSRYGNWGAFLDAIHERFLDDFVRSKPTWPGKRFNLKRHPEYDGKSATFWHIISEGPIEDERMPDLRRCEQIAWPRAIITAFPNRKPREGDRMVWWKNQRKGESRILLALTDFSYLVVMADRGSYIMLWTAYPVEKEHQRRKLRRDFEDYWNNPPATNG